MRKPTRTKSREIWIELAFSDAQGASSSLEKSEQVGIKLIFVRVGKSV